MLYKYKNISRIFTCDFSFAAGFERSQAELIVSALVTLTTANMDIVYKDMVTKAQQVGATCYTTNTVVLMST